ncbi:MAG: M48 family metallopeptidase [Thermales bacterium]|nr:M48 family metallopeptidase [Thermales bacterium]
MLKKYSINVKPELRVRKMKTRWGSCYRSKYISLNPILIKSPVECVDYVITHEICHLDHKPHNKNFYQLLSRRVPEWKKIKLKLEKSYC